MRDDARTYLKNPGVSAVSPLVIPPSVKYSYVVGSSCFVFCRDSKLLFLLDSTLGPTIIHTN